MKTCFKDSETFKIFSFLTSLSGLSLLLLIALSTAVYAKKNECSKQIKPLLEGIKGQLDELHKTVQEMLKSKTTVEGPGVEGAEGDSR